MTRYIHHTGGIIDFAAGPLPRSWRNVSGLDKATTTELRALGWLPVVEDAPEYDPATQQLAGPTGVAIGDEVPFGAHSVTATYTVEPWAAPVPLSVSPLQARRALRAAGLHDAVSQWIAGQDSETQDAWEYAIFIERTDPIVSGAGAALGMTDAQLDDLFRLAATL